MWIVIVGAVIASMISAAILISALAAGKCGDEWIDESDKYAPPARNENRFIKPAPRANPR